MKSKNDVSFYHMAINSIFSHFLSMFSYLLDENQSLFRKVFSLASTSGKNQINHNAVKMLSVSRLMLENILLYL